MSTWRISNWLLQRYKITSHGCLKRLICIVGCCETGQPGDEFAEVVEIRSLKCVTRTETMHVGLMKMIWEADSPQRCHGRNGCGDQLSLVTNAKSD